MKSFYMLWEKWRPHIPVVVYLFISLFLSGPGADLKPELLHVKTMWPLNPSPAADFSLFSQHSAGARRFLSVCVAKLGQRKLLGAANDLINWFRRLLTYILQRVSLSFGREIDVPRSAPTASHPIRSLPGLSAEPGWSSGKEPKYLAPPRLPRGRLGVCVCVGGGCWGGSTPK